MMKVLRTAGTKAGCHTRLQFSDSRAVWAHTHRQAQVRNFWEYMSRKGLAFLWGALQAVISGAGRLILLCI